MTNMPPDFQPPEDNNLGPIEQKRAGTNWLPFILGGVVLLAFICALVFVIFAVFYFRAEIPTQSAELTPTPADIVTYQESSEESGSPQDSFASAALVEALELDANPSDQLYEMASPDYGIHAFLFWRPEIASRDLNFIADAGFTWVKQEFAWREIEGAGKGIFNWDNADRMMDQIGEHNLKVIARVGVQPEWAGGGYPEIGPPDNYQDFGDYLFALAERYKGRIQAYQIWNEPNLAREWGEHPPSPVEYTALLKVAYEAIKKADPQAYVISAGLAPTTRHDQVAMPDIYFVQGLYDAGAAPYFDLLGVHAPGYKAPPEMDPGEIARDSNFSNPGDHARGVPEELRRVYGFRHVEDIRAIMVANQDVDKRVAVLEFGWTIDNRPDSPYSWHGVTTDQQAEYLVNAFQYAKTNWQPWIGVMTIIFWPHPDWKEGVDEQWYWSIAISHSPDEAWPHPSYWKLHAMPK